MGNDKPPTEGPPTQIGPRGGTTTVRPSGEVRANLWLTSDQHERLRLWAFKLRRSQTDLIREGIDYVLSKLEAKERRGADHGRGEEGGSP